MSRRKSSSKTHKQKKTYFTYLVKSDYIPNILVDKIFKELYGSLWKPYNSTKKTQSANIINKIEEPNFKHLDGHFNRNSVLNNQHSFLRNVVDDNKYTIANKLNLYHNLKNYSTIRKNIVKQIDFDIKKIYTRHDKITNYKKYFNNTNIWICKPVGGFSGQYIKIFNDYSKFAKYIQEMINLHRTKFNQPKNKNKVVSGQDLSLSKDFSKWIIQEYIDNPLLIDNRKFHIRAYFLYYNKDNINKGYISTLYEIALARDKYVSGNYFNSRIHDTHFYDDYQPRYFPRDFPYNNDIKKKVTNQVNLIAKFLLQKIKAGCYDDATNCFEVFGVDLMVDTNHNVKLLEVNTKIGYPKPDNDPMNFCEKLFRGLIETVVNDFYPESHQKFIKKHKTNSGFFIPVYD